MRINAKSLLDHGHHAGPDAHDRESVCFSKLRFDALLQRLVFLAMVGAITMKSHIQPL